MPEAARRAGVGTQGGGRHPPGAEHRPRERGRARPIAIGGGDAEAGGERVPVGHLHAGDVPGDRQAPRSSWPGPTRRDEQSHPMRMIFVAPSTRHPSGGVAVIYEMATAMATRGHDVDLYHMNFFDGTVSTMDELRWFTFPGRRHPPLPARGTPRPRVDPQRRRHLRVPVRSPDGAAVRPARRAGPGLEDAGRQDRAARVRGAVPQGLRRRLAGRGWPRPRGAGQRAGPRADRHPPRHVPVDTPDRGAPPAPLVLLQLTPAEGCRSSPSTSSTR